MRERVALAGVIHKRATERWAISVQHWAERADWETVCRRAGGRRGYNARRRFLALYRRRRLLDLALKHRLSLFDHGAQAELARRLGVHRSGAGNNRLQAATGIDDRAA